jgi:hypothetical protein
MIIFCGGEEIRVALPIRLSCPAIIWGKITTLMHEMTSFWREVASPWREMGSLWF